jgi:carbonyl reductase 1
MVLVIFIVLLVLGSTRGMSVSTTGRVCVVTGANKGIGYEVAKIVASTPGWVTVVASRDEARGQRAVEFFRQQGLNAICRQLDITDAQSIETFTRNLAAEYSKVDCLVNNAGIAFKSSDPTPFPQQARPTLETNFFGTVNLTQKLLPLILKSDEPRIVQVASGSGHISILPEGALKDTFMALERGESDLTLEGLESIANQFIADISASKNLSEWPNSCYGMRYVFLHS